MARLLPHLPLPPPLLRCDILRQCRCSSGCSSASSSASSSSAFSSAFLVDGTQSHLPLRRIFHDGVLAVRIMQRNVSVQCLAHSKELHFLVSHDAPLGVEPLHLGVEQRRLRLLRKQLLANRG
jgi:hypothetical protein